jgi:hypothetical protein
MINNFLGFLCRNVHVECPFLTSFQLLNYIHSDDFFVRTECGHCCVACPTLSSLPEPSIPFSLVHIQRWNS